MKKTVIIVSILIIFLVFSTWFVVNRTTFEKEKISSSVDEDYYKGFSSVYYHDNKDYLLRGGCVEFGCFNYVPLVKKLDADSIFFKRIMDSYYYKDKRAVYYFGKKLAGVDAASFEIINNPSEGSKNEYSKDYKNVYRAGIDNLGKNTLNIIDGADPKTFWFIDKHYAKDIRNIYYFEKEFIDNVGNIIPQTSVTVRGADPVTFISLECDFYKDKTDIYYRGKKIEVADMQTFIKLPECYFKDKNYVYHNAFYIREKSGIITDADPNTFHQVSKYTFTDKNYTYEYGRKLNK